MIFTAHNNNNNNNQNHKKFSIMICFTNRTTHALNNVCVCVYVGITVFGSIHGAMDAHRRRRGQTRAKKRSILTYQLAACDAVCNKVVKQSISSGKLLIYNLIQHNELSFMKLCIYLGKFESSETSAKAARLLWCSSRAAFFGSQL